jgi:hypothetical protein
VGRHGANIVPLFFIADAAIAKRDASDLAG